jgi:hypothetical protein
MGRGHENVGVFVASDAREWNDQLMDRCDECGFVYEEHDKMSVVSEIRDLGPRFTAVLVPDRTEFPDRDRLTRRPSADVWSAVEYGCHVRDMLLTQRERLFQALVEDEPSFVPMYRDPRALLARYGDESPEQVAAEICFAARLAAWAFEGLDASSWTRTCTYNYPVPCTRTLLWLAQHIVHEGEHHLFDIMRLSGSSMP